MNIATASTEVLKRHWKYRILLCRRTIKKPPLVGWAQCLIQSTNNVRIDLEPNPFWAQNSFSSFTWSQNYYMYIRVCNDKLTIISAIAVIYLMLSGQLLKHCSQCLVVFCCLTDWFRYWTKQIHKNDDGDDDKLIYLSTETGMYERVSHCSSKDREQSTAESDVITNTVIF